MKIPRKSLEIGIAAVLTLVAATIVLLFFAQLPIEGTSLGLDWDDIWRSIRLGEIVYGTYGLFNPPWTVALILPLGFLSFRISWGLITLATISGLIASVPRTSQRRINVIAILLLLTSFPALRQLADGNLEAFVIIGALLLLHGYRNQNPWLLSAGALLATSKIQEVWLMLIVLAIYMLIEWPLRRWLVAAAVTFTIVGLSMIWLGQTWLDAAFSIPYRGTLIDISLPATLNRINTPPWLTTGLCLALLGVTALVIVRVPRIFTRESAGFLIAASMLLAPYTAANSFLTLLAIGLIPFLQKNPRAGVILIALVDVLYLLPATILYYQAPFWTLMLLLTWGVFLRQLKHTPAQIKPMPATPQSTSYS